MRWTKSFAGLLGLALVGPALAQGPDRFTTEWIDRPWEYRYLIYADAKWAWASARKRQAEEQAKNPQAVGESGERFESNFDPILTLAFAGEEPSDHLEILRLDVRSNRTLAQPNLRGDYLRPRLNRLERIVLTPADDKPSYVVKFGFLFMGAVGASDTRYSPSVCSFGHGDGTPIDSNSRYARGFSAEWGPTGYFGCREWAAQLYDSQRPYIDVTSYEMIEDLSAKVKKGKKPPRVPATFIKPFVGFSRYDSPPKPVIGNHQGQWFCITDCPAGDAPGPIADMHAWVKRSGWAMPKKPKDVREFRDRPVKAEDLAE